MAAQNQINTVKIMAKDLVRTRNYINRFIEMKTQLSAVGLKIQAIKSHEAMASAMKGIIILYIQYIYVDVSIVLCIYSV